MHDIFKDALAPFLRRPKIATSHSRKPIPTDKFDWCASFDHDEPDHNGNMMVGFGPTEEDAIDDLIYQLED